MKNSRERAIETAERLFRSQGYAATGLTQIQKESGSPKGSFYFHFPRGKQELALVALEAYGRRVERALREAAADHPEDPIAFVREVSRTLTREMEASGWRLSCLNQTLAAELVPADASMSDAVSAVFRSWIDQVVKVMAPITGGSRKEAERLATMLVAGMAGARNIARVFRSPAPFDAVADTVIESIRLLAEQPAVASKPVKKAVKRSSAVATRTRRKPG